MVTQDGCIQMATRIEVRYDCEGVLPNGHPEGVLPNGHSGLLPPASLLLGLSRELRSGECCQGASGVPLASLKGRCKGMHRPGA